MPFAATSQFVKRWLRHDRQPALCRNFLLLVASGVCASGVVEFTGASTTTRAFGQAGLQTVRWPSSPINANSQPGRSQPGNSTNQGWGPAPAVIPPGYEEHFVTEMQDQYRTIQVPVMENQRAAVVPWWDPFGVTAPTYQTRAVIRWETRVEKVRVPVRSRILVAKDPAAASRLAQSPANGRSTAAAARPAPQFGGISQIESEQPRLGMRPVGSQGTVVQ